MSNTSEIKCARCDCALKGPTNPQPQDRISCPQCGEGDTFENVIAELGEYIKEQASQALHNALVDGVRGSKNLKVTSDFRPKGGHRFICDVGI